MWLKWINLTYFKYAPIICTQNWYFRKYVLPLMWLLLFLLRVIPNSSCLCLWYRPVRGARKWLKIPMLYMPCIERIIVWRLKSGECYSYNTLDYVVVTWGILMNWKCDQSKENARNEYFTEDILLAITICDTNFLANIFARGEIDAAAAAAAAPITHTYW